MCNWEVCQPSRPLPLCRSQVSLMLTEEGNAAIRVGVTEALLYVCRPSIAAGCLARRSGHESAPDALVFMMIMHDDCTAA